MQASTSRESKAQQVLQEADTYVRENPVPAVLCAVAIGFGVGLLVRALERPTAMDLIEERRGELGGYVRSFLSPFARETTHAYRKSREAVQEAVHAAKDIDVEDYTDPVVRWFNRLWSKCCG